MPGHISVQIASSTPPSSVIIVKKWKQKTMIVTTHNIMPSRKKWPLHFAHSITPYRLVGWPYISCPVAYSSLIVVVVAGKVKGGGGRRSGERERVERQLTGFSSPHSPLPFPLSGPPTARNSTASALSCQSNDDFGNGHQYGVQFFSFLLLLLLSSTHMINSFMFFFFFNFFYNGFMIVWRKKLDDYFVLLSRKSEYSTIFLLNYR